MAAKEEDPVIPASSNAAGEDVREWTSDRPGDRRVTADKDRKPRQDFVFTTRGNRSEYEMRLCHGRQTLGRFVRLESESAGEEELQSGWNEEQDAVGSVLPLIGRRNSPRTTDGNSSSPEQPDTKSALDELRAERFAVNDPYAIGVTPALVQRRKRELGHQDMRPQASRPRTCPYIACVCTVDGARASNASRFPATARGASGRADAEQRGGWTVEVPRSKSALDSSKIRVRSAFGHTAGNRNGRLKDPRGDYKVAAVKTGSVRRGRTTDVGAHVQLTVLCLSLSSAEAPPAQATTMAAAAAAASRWSSATATRAHADLTSRVDRRGAYDLAARRCEPDRFPRSRMLLTELRAERREGGTSNPHPVLIVLHKEVSTLHAAAQQLGRAFNLARYGARARIPRGRSREIRARRRRVERGKITRSTRRQIHCCAPGLTCSSLGLELERSLPSNTQAKMCDLSDNIRSSVPSKRRQNMRRLRSSTRAYRRRVATGDCQAPRSSSRRTDVPRRVQRRRKREGVREPGEAVQDAPNVEEVDRDLVDEGECFVAQRVTGCERAVRLRGNSLVLDARGAQELPTPPSAHPTKRAVACKNIVRRGLVRACPARRQQGRVQRRGARDRRRSKSRPALVERGGVASARAGRRTCASKGSALPRAARSRRFRSDRVSSQAQDEREDRCAAQLGRSHTARSSPGGRTRKGSGKEIATLQRISYNRCSLEDYIEVLRSKQQEFAALPSSSPSCLQPTSDLLPESAHKRAVEAYSCVRSARLEVLMHRNRINHDAVESDGGGGVKTRQTSVQCYVESISISETLSWWRWEATLQFNGDFHSSLRSTKITVQGDGARFASSAWVLLAPWEALQNAPPSSSPAHRSERCSRSTRKHVCNLALYGVLARLHICDEENQARECSLQNGAGAYITRTSTKRRSRWCTGRLDPELLGTSSRTSAPYGRTNPMSAVSCAVMREGVFARAAFARALFEPRASTGRTAQSAARSTHGGLRRRMESTKVSIEGTRAACGAVLGQQPLGRQRLEQQHKECFERAARLRSDGT
ncbi:hypothetical protein B0H15DRAFT_803838 [Mycena belliarum]|uniref:Uncharacterized protein n=1 Tax=Mycena belliarum TaxID=1033014 RepID=A0AAD6XKG2_9AGAR|nr:hypothetical protein B0H15DRAFT_803838 [Mycena belliae]